MRRIGARRSAALLAALSLCASACTQARRPTAASSSSPQAGGSLIVAVRDLGSLDPAKASWRGALAIESQIFRPLTVVDPATHLVHAGAARSWRVSADGLTWTFRIESASYSDGAPVTSGDFKFAFDRLTARSTASDVAFQLRSVAGFREAHDAGTAKGLSGVTAPTPAALVVKLVAPFADLPYVLANPRLVPLEQRAYARSTKRLDATPVGNGAFRVTHIEPGVKLRLEPNTRFAGRKPYLSLIEFRVVDSIDEGWRRFAAKTVDVAEIPPTVLDPGPSPDPGGLTPVWATLSFGINLHLAKYADANVRRALSLAINRDAIARTVYNGTKDVATGIVPEGIRGYAPGACPVCTFDRTRADSMIHAAFPSGIPPIAIDHLNDATSRRVAGAIASDLNGIGVRAILRPHARKEYVSFLQAGKQDLAQLGWISDASTPDAFLAEQLGSGSPNNQTGFHDGVFDGYINGARAQGDEVKRLALYRAAEKRAMQLVPLIPIVFFRNRTAISARVHGFLLDGAGVFDGSAIWVS